MCTFDWDSILAYKTQKVVKVRHRVLGILYLLFISLIIIYEAIYVMWLEKGYLQKEVPVGSLSTTLLKPQCLTDPNIFDYCQPGHHYTQIPCVIWDKDDVVYPKSQDKTAFFATRVTRILQQRNCEDNAPCEYPYKNIDSHSFYIADIENYTMRLRHSVQARSFYRSTGEVKYSAASDVMQGALVDINGNVMSRFDSEEADIFYLRTLLQAANTSLLELSDSLGSENETLRYAGLTLIFSIDYTNFDSEKLNNIFPSIQYTYSVNRALKTESKVVENIYLNATHRILQNRHGIKVVFIQSGEIGRFSFQQMLVELVSGLGLLSVASLVIESLMLYCLKARDKYAAYKFEETEDFDHRRTRRLLLDPSVNVA